MVCHIHIHSTIWHTTRPNPDTFIHTRPPQELADGIISMFQVV